MGKWTDYEIQRDFTDWADLCDAHNADCAAYEATIAELTFDRDSETHWAGTMDSAYDKAAELRECAAAWEPGVRLLGNVRADEIIGILDACEKRVAELEAQCIAERQQAAGHYQNWLAATATLERLREVVPEDADGWCYECGDIVTTYHYGGSGNPQCAKCRSSKTDCLPSGLEEFLPKIRDILYPTCPACNGGGGWHEPEHDHEGQCCGQVWVDCHNCSSPIIFPQPKPEETTDDE